MAKNVKGVIFLDYARMIKKHKHLDWDKHLEPEDREILSQMILPSQWYPLESYQRMGLAVFHEFAKGDVETVRAWGRTSMDEMLKVYKTLVEEGEPLRTIEKFKILRSRFFDFEGIEIEPRPGNRVHIKVDLAFEGVAEEAYALQTLGGFERLLELSGAKEIRYQFLKKAWEGDGETVIDLSWE
jgi:hypothetical protein